MPASYSYVTQLINNPTREPSITVLFALADVLGVENPKDLFMEPLPIESSGARQSLPEEGQRSQSSSA
jgi:hypothetical protein